MNRGTRLALAIVLILIFYAALCLWWANSPKPYERPRAHTAAEARLIAKALRYHGNVTFITTKTRIYFKRDGQEILIARRGL